VAVEETRPTTVNDSYGHLQTPNHFVLHFVA
jgi:hypothetical protein